jgi:hypothetical protein
MKIMTQQEILQSAKIVILALLLTVGIGAIHANWAAPQDLPPICQSGDAGCDGPLNPTNTAQSKLGALLVGTASDASQAALRVPLGQLLVGQMAANSSYKINTDGYINGGSASAGGLCIRGVCKDTWPTGGSGGGMTSGGSNGHIPLFSPNGQTLTDSIMSQSGSNVTVEGTVKITGGSPNTGRVLTSNGAGQGSWQPVALTCPENGTGGTECQQAQQNNGTGNGTWRAINCRLTETDGLTGLDPSLVGGVLSFNNGYWRRGWTIGSAPCQEEVLIVRIGS